MAIAVVIFEVAAGDLAKLVFSSYLSTLIGRVDLLSLDVIELWSIQLGCGTLRLNPFLLFQWCIRNLGGFWITIAYQL